MPGKVLTLPVVQFIRSDISIPAVTNQGTPGATTYGYQIVLVSSQDGSTTDASAQGQTTTGNATLSASDFNRLTWSLPTLAPGVTVTAKVYRVVGGATQGLIGTTSGTTFDDTGISGDGSAVPATNSTGVGGWVDTSQLDDMWVQLSPSIGWVANFSLEASTDKTAADGPVASSTLSSSTRSKAIAVQTLPFLRIRMTSYTSGSLPTCNIAGHLR